MRIRYIISEKWEPKHITTFVNAITFAVNYLKLEEPKSTLTVKLINGTEDEVEEATAEHIKSKRYEIRVARSRLCDQPLRAIFHELVHVKQFVRDGLKVFPDGTTLYKGSKYTVEDVESYLLAPWEMEARAMEEALMILFEEE